jgi:hypothetical protein
MGQLEITLRALRERGARGVHTFELRSGVFGACIGNPSERIARLERLGHVIRTGAKEPLHGNAVGVRYFLVQDAERHPRGRDTGTQPSTSLPPDWRSQRVEGHPDIGDPMKREPNRSQHEWPGIPQLQSWEGRQTGKPPEASAVLFDASVYAPAHHHDGRGGW